MPMSSIIVANKSRNACGLVASSFVIFSIIVSLPSNKSRNEKLYIAAGLSASSLIYSLQLIYRKPGLPDILGIAHDNQKSFDKKEKMLYNICES